MYVYMYVCMYVCMYLIFALKFLIKSKMHLLANVDTSSSIATKFALVWYIIKQTNQPKSTLETEVLMSDDRPAPKYF